MGTANVGAAETVSRLQADALGYAFSLGGHESNLARSEEEGVHEKPGEEEGGMR
jgi:hypothetical protein